MKTNGTFEPLLIQQNDTLTMMSQVFNTEKQNLYFITQVRDSQAQVVPFYELSRNEVVAMCSKLMNCMFQETLIMDSWSDLLSSKHIVMKVMEEIKYFNPFLDYIKSDESYNSLYLNTNANENTSKHISFIGRLMREITSFEFDPRTNILEEDFVSILSTFITIHQKVNKPQLGESSIIEIVLENGTVGVNLHSVNSNKQTF